MHIVKDFLFVVVLFIAVYVGFYLVHRHDTLEDKMRRYDCTMTEFLPDVPAEVRNECRRRIIERLNQQQGQ